MTILDDIIDASTDSSVATPDLLRRVQVAAHRLGALEIVAWVKQELTGFDDSAVLPTYRIMTTNVIGHFVGPFQSWRNHQLTTRPNEMASLWQVEMREPLFELQALSEGEGELRRSWAATNVKRYEDSRVFYFEGMGLLDVWNVISRQSISGVLDVVRSKAMEFALDLQTQSPEAGSVGGPVVAAGTPLAQTVYTITNNIYGHGTNIGAGEHVTQTSYVTKGDETALRREAIALGLTPADANEFVRALAEDQSVESPRVSGFIAKVRSGAIAVGAALGSDVAAGALVELGKAFLGLS